MLLFKFSDPGAIKSLVLFDYESSLKFELEFAAYCNLLC